LIPLARPFSNNRHGSVSSIASHPTQALESGETKKRRIEVAKAELQQQRLLTGKQGRPSMLRRLVKSVTSTSGASLESTIKALTGEVSFARLLLSLTPSKQAAF